MIGIIFSCAIEHYEERVPTAVSLPLTRCEAPTNLLKVENDQENYKGPRQHITACIGQIYNGFDDINQLVEMVEVNLIVRCGFHCSLQPHQLCYTGPLHT